MYQRFLRLKDKFIYETFKETIMDGTDNRGSDNV